MLQAAMGTHDLGQGAFTPVWTYGGSYPAPTIRVRKGDMLSVQLVNRLAEPTNIHWHGQVTPADMDGHPRDLVAPGASRTYAFPVRQRTGTYWYHPHTHMATGKQAYMGMASSRTARSRPWACRQASWTCRCCCRTGASPPAAPSPTRRR
jgi:FtsP/CotA-like multicopper oxidase with cupredoxin domain